MRFRGRFSWFQFSAAVMWTVLGFVWFRQHPHDGIGQAYLALGIVQLCVAGSGLTSYFFNWWGITDDGLVHHRLWSERTIPWDEITRVGPWQPSNRPMYHWLEVDFARNAPISDRGHLLMAPADREGLLQALRAHAPQADFDSFQQA